MCLHPGKEGFPFLAGQALVCLSLVAGHTVLLLGWTVLPRETLTGLCFLAGSQDHGDGVALVTMVHFPDPRQCLREDGLLFNQDLSGVLILA